jgi:FkbM family methyltransferase
MRANTDYEFHGQFEEDKHIFDKYVNGKLIEPTYIEAGALDGIRYSNTKFFEDCLGWKGILVEPNPMCYEALIANRPGNYLADCLLSNEVGPLEYLYYVNPNLAAVSGVKSTLSDKNFRKFYDNDDEWISKQIKTNLRSTSKQTRRLSDVIRDSGHNEIGFFSLDVEGHELSVLESFDFDFEISLMLVERNESSNLTDELLLDKGYVKLEKIAHNMLYASKEYMKRNSAPLVAT